MRRPLLVLFAVFAIAASACGGGTSLTPAPGGSGATIPATLRMVIPGPHRAARAAKRGKFVSPSTDGVLVEVYPHGAERTLANRIARAAVDVSPGSPACGGKTGFPRTCTAAIGLRPTTAANDDFSIDTYDAPPSGGEFAGAHLLAYGELGDQPIVRGRDNDFVVYLGGIVTGLSGNAAFVSMPGDGKTHALAIAIDPVDYGDNPIAAGSKDPFANPIEVSVGEKGGSGHASLSLDGGSGAAAVTVRRSDQTVQLRYDGDGAIGYGVTVTLRAPAFRGFGGATETIDVGPLLAGGSAEYRAGRLDLRGNGDRQHLDVGESGARSGTTYAVTAQSCSAIADFVAFKQTSVSSAEFVALARGMSAAALCKIDVSDGTANLRIDVSNAYSGVLGTPAFSEFGALTQYAAPEGITVGPDGAMWTAEYGNHSLMRVTATGSNPAKAEYSMPNTYGTPYPSGVAAGPDGDLWWADRAANAASSTVGKMTTSGAATAYATQNGLTRPTSIVAGPDGAMWFTEWNENAIGRVTTSGSIGYFTNGIHSNSDPQDIVLGPDGNLWFTQYVGASIARITPAGTVTEFGTPTASSYPYGIAVGPDGAIWFTESFKSKIARIAVTATSGSQITEYPLPTASARPYGIAAGPDGAIWFVEHDKGKIGRLDPAKAAPNTSDGITEYGTPSGASSGPTGITGGPDGAIWFTESTANKVGRIAIATTAVRRRGP